MKLIFRDIGQIQRFKRGADPVSGAILGGASLVGNIAGSIIGSDSSESNVSRQLNAQREENQKNRDWQTAEAEKNRNFQLGTMNTAMAHQTSEREAQQAYQSEQWQNQFQEELAHRFDVPQGVNPAVYFSSHGAASGSGGSVSAPSGSMPSSPSGAMPSGVAGLNAVGYQPFNLQVPQLMSALGSMMSGLANAKKAGVETTLIEETTESEVRKAIAAADMAQLNVALGKLDQEFQSKSFPYRLKMVEADYKKVLTDIGLTEKKILSEDEEIKLKEATRKMNEALEDYYKSSKKEKDITILSLPSLIESQILSNRGSAAAGFGSAKLSSSLAMTEDAIRNLKVDGQRLYNEGLDNENRFNQTTFLDRVQKVLKENNILDNKLLLQRIEANDKEAYNAIQRIFFGRGVDGDAKKVLKALSNLDLVQDQ